MAIIETTFGPKQYLALKKSISTDQVTDKSMYDVAGKKLGAYMQEHNITPIGPWSVIYFTWNEEEKKTDLAIAFPVSGLTEVNDPELSIVEIPQLNAAMDTLIGGYKNLGDFHMTLAQHVQQSGNFDNTLSVFALEEYEIGPMQNPDPTEWRTNVYHMHK